jgi:hypothetical protein
VTTLAILCILWIGVAISLELADYLSARRGQGTTPTQRAKSSARKWDSTDARIYVVNVEDVIIPTDRCPECGAADGPRYGVVSRPFAAVSDDAALDILLSDGGYDGPRRSER